MPYIVLDGWPYHPAGRTGRTGRDLGRWGENCAVDPLVITNEPGPGPAAARRRVLLIQREDCGAWAIPGGMVDPGETAPAALTRELWEETGIDLAGTPRVELFRGLVDDPRATDHAWIVSTLALFYVPAVLAPTAGSDALAASWFPFANLDQLGQALTDRGAELYPAHRPLLAHAADWLNTDTTD